MRKKHINEIKGVIFFALGILLLVSLVTFTPNDLSFYTSNPNVPAHNLIRGVGAAIAGALFFLFGWGCYFFSALIFFWGAVLFKQEDLDFRLPQLIGFVFFILSTSSLMSMAGNLVEYSRFARGGYFGFTLSNFVTTYLGRFGGFVVFLTLAILSFILVTEILISTFFKHFSKRINAFLRMSVAFFAGLIGKIKMPSFKLKKKARAASKPRIAGMNEDKEDKLKVRPEVKAKPKDASEEEDDEEELKSFIPPKIQIRAEQKPAQAQTVAKPKPQPVVIGNYQLPTLDLLDSPPPIEERKIKDDLTSNARILEETLADFGISVKVTDIEKGPTVTRYELEPAPGVKITRIISLGDDIALTMKAPGVRIEAPIPGKARVGIEVPNTTSSMVFLKEVFSTPEFINSKAKLTLALGKDIAGKPLIADLADMPHLLIAGTTGSGKTVCVNGIILSFLYKCSPQDIKFIMIDPKMVELAVFNDIPHLLCPVLTDPKKVGSALNWLVSEMGARFQILARAGARNILAYNAQNPNDKMPYIVLVVDELADLMMVARDQVEGAIARLAQLSRAVGIHLILATQRPSVDVITGVIKANFPARISFKVASQVDSRTVLDGPGADKLLGKGDMLFLKPGEAKLIRGQSSYVKDKEIDKVVSFIKPQGEPCYEESILKENKNTGLDDGEKDELFEDAVRMVMETGQASVSVLQRRMGLGYMRAARLIDSMEQAGIVGPHEGSKPRKILTDRKEWLKQAVQKENAPVDAEPPATQ